MIQDYRLASFSKQAYENNILTLNYEVEFIECQKTDTQLYFLSNEKEQIIAFRGTEITLTNFKDIITDLKCKPENNIHKGFLKAFESVQERIHSRLDKNKETIYTGHSLGGALAQLGGFFHPYANEKVVTFGAPRVFAGRLAEVAQEFIGHLTFNYVNYLDPIPHVPPSAMGYAPVGHNIYLCGNKFMSMPSPFAIWFELITSRLKTKLNAHKIDNYIKKLDYKG